MADIFISYSKNDYAVAEELADFLLHAGFEVWLRDPEDNTVAGGHAFTNEIMDALDASTVVVVIWSDASITSEYVIDAAEHAKEHNKLITTRLPNFDVKRLPVEFERRQAYPVTDRDRLMEALASFGLKRAPKARSHLTRGEVRRAAKTDKEWARIANEESVEAKAKHEKRLLQRADRLTERYPRLYVIAGAVLFGVLAFWWLFA